MCRALKEGVAYSLSLLFVAISVTSGIAAQSKPIRDEVEGLLASALSTSAEKTAVPLTQGSARFTLAEDGFLRYLAASPGAHFPVEHAASAQHDEIARAFMRDRGPAFGVMSTQVAFTTLRSKQTGLRDFVRLQQVYSGIPVFAAEVIVQLDAANGVECVLSDILRDTSPLDAGQVSLQAGLGGDAAVAMARAEFVAKAPPGTDAAFTAPELTLYAPSVLEMEGAPRLVWKTRVSSDAAPELTADLLIDAHRGTILQRFSRCYEALNRQVYDANNTIAEPGTLTRAEGNPASGIIDVDNAYQFLGDTYNFYQTENGRDGIDNAGMTLSATVRQCYVGESCPVGNAFWNAGRMHFGAGFAIDDVTGHELTHGVTENESHLVYANTSGAINESFSDVWGEFIDLGNGAGNDAAMVRWLLGEDLPGGGALRSMKNPPSFGHPDRRGSSNYVPPVGTPDDSNDQGGVHTNSGINNKLCFLLTDGDYFNGHTISGMGISMVADLYYEAQTNLLTSSPDWTDFANALQQAAVNLGWGNAGRSNLFCALVAVEIAVDSVDPAITCPAEISPPEIVRGGCRGLPRRYVAESHINGPASSEERSSFEIQMGSTAGTARVSVYDVRGHHMGVLYREFLEAGAKKRIPWPTSVTKEGRRLMPGVYLIQFAAPGVNQVRRLLIPY